MGGACGRFVCEAVADVAEDLRRLRTKKIYSDATVARHRDTFKSLKLSEDAVARLHKVFRKIDQDGSGQIDLWELLDHLDLQRSKFAKRVFSIFDEDGTSTIDFREFVVTLWQYCTLGRAQLVLFAFDLYDRDSSGEIDVEELNAMLKELYGKRYASNNIAVSLLNRIRGMSGKDGASTVRFEASVAVLF
ncbi:hypothetical protein M885DRAFT_58880 [Pelagophyceae sp. CCMP2097]|nr:hypothetical protein M885DRAFT_58880 [Pelagophyceae sp. CCMP2097]